MGLSGAKPIINGSAEISMMVFAPLNPFYADTAAMSSFSKLSPGRTWENTTA